MATTSATNASRRPLSSLLLSSLVVAATCVVAVVADDEQHDLDGLENHHRYELRGDQGRARQRGAAEALQDAVTAFKAGRDPEQMFSTVGSGRDGFDASSVRYENA